MVLLVPDCDDVVFLFQFTFAKIWLLYAQFEIRQKNLQGARKVMVRFTNTEEVSKYIFLLFKSTKSGAKQN